MRGTEIQRDIEWEKVTETDRHRAGEIGLRKKNEFICLFGFLTSSSTTGLYRGQVPRLTSDNVTYCHTRD